MCVDVVHGSQAVEDKTFGMKNKKGAKGQQKVQQVKQSIDATAAKGQGYASPFSYSNSVAASVRAAPMYTQSQSELRVHLPVNLWHSSGHHGSYSHIFLPRLEGSNDCGIHNTISLN